MTVYEAQELREMYESDTMRIVAECVTETEMFGGQPAGEPGVRAFCQHQLHLAGDELEQAVRRIMREEIGERPTVGTQEGGEVQEVESYGVNVFRHDEDGCCWLGNWQIKAAFKQAASRRGYFQQKRGTKGDVAEMGEVEAAGISARQGGWRQRIRVMGPDGEPWMGNVFVTLRGRVNTPQGAKSIVHDSEVAPPGCRFTWQMRIAKGKWTEHMVAKTVAVMQVIGLGSVRSLEKGKIRVERLEVHC